MKFIKFLKRDDIWVVKNHKYEELGIIKFHDKWKKHKLMDYIGKNKLKVPETEEFECKKCGDKTKGIKGSMKLKLKMCSNCIVNDWDNIKNKK